MLDSIALAIQTMGAFFDVNGRHHNGVLVLQAPLGSSS